LFDPLARVESQPSKNDNPLSTNTPLPAHLRAQSMFSIPKQDLNVISHSLGCSSMPPWLFCVPPKGLALSPPVTGRLSRRPISGGLAGVGTAASSEGNAPQLPAHNSTNVPKQTPTLCTRLPLLKSASFVDGLLNRPVFEIHFVEEDALFVVCFNERPLRAP